MAKQTHRLKESVRNLTLRVEHLEVKLGAQESRLVAFATIVRRNGLEDQIADVPQSAASIGRANSPLEQHIEAITGTLQPVVEIEQAKPMESRNTPEKKHNRQKWCLRIVEIRAECDVSVDSLTLHRLNDPCRNQNWRTIERAAKTVVIDDDSKQDLPLVGLIFVYAARLRMKVLELAQDAQLDHSSIERDKAALYNTRAASLLTLLREIRTAHGKKFKANPLW